MSNLFFYLYNYNIAGSEKVPQGQWGTFLLPESGVLNPCSRHVLFPNSSF